MGFRNLRLRARALLAPRRVERELVDELAFHVECEARKLIAGGLTPGDARAQAKARFGSIALAADRCRDQRGTTFVESSVSDVLYALRGFSRAPLAACTIVGTVALGLGLVAVVFTVFNAFFFRTDDVRNPHELFTVQQVTAPAARAWMAWTRPQFETLRREAPALADASAVLRGIGARIDGRTMNGTLRHRKLLPLARGRRRDRADADSRRRPGRRSAGCRAQSPGVEQTVRE